MAKYLAQIVMLGAQVVGRAFSRALRQEFAASQSAANQRRSNNGSNDRVINAKLGMSLQEAMQILNVENKDLSPELIDKNYKHLFDVNDKSKGGSFYIQSKKCVQNWKLMDSLRYHWNAFQTLSTIRGNQCNQMKTFLPIIPSNGLHTKDSNNIYEEAINEQNIQNCIHILQSIRVFRPKKSFKIGRSVRNAAVLVPFCRNKDKEPSILLTQRSNNMNSHRGEVCFPGGIEEAHDNNQMIRTAVRETVEELGIDESRVKVYGVLNPFPASSGSAVHPVLGFIDLNDLDLNSNINREEVEDVFIIPLKHLCDDTNWGFTKWKVGWTTPVYNDKSPDIPKVWGLTAGILYAVMSALLPNVVRAKERVDEELIRINPNDSTTSDQSFDKKQSENQ